MITVTFQAKDLADLQRQMGELLGTNQVQVDIVRPELLAPATTEGIKRGPGRPRKSEATAAPEVPGQTAIPGPPMDVKAEPKAETVGAPPPATQAAAEMPTLDDVKTAVKKLTEFRPKVDKNTQDSIRRAVPVLQQFGATTIKELKPEQYANFIAACQKA